MATTSPANSLVGSDPKSVLADAGYLSEENLEALEERPEVVIRQADIAVQREHEFACRRSQAPVDVDPKTAVLLALHHHDARLMRLQVGDRIVRGLGGSSIRI